MSEEIQKAINSANEFAQYLREDVTGEFNLTAASHISGMALVAGNLDRNIDQLQRKNDELVARVANLKETANLARMVLNANGEKNVAEKICSVLNETKSQPLQHIEAAAVDTFIRERFELSEDTMLSVANIKSLGVAHNIQLRQQSTNDEG